MTEELQVVFTTDRGTRLIRDAQCLKEFPPEELVVGVIDVDTAAAYDGERLVKAEMLRSGSVVAMRVFPNHLLLVLNPSNRMELRWSFCVGEE